MAKKTDGRVIKEFTEATLSRDRKRMENAQFDMDIMHLSKWTNLQEIKVFLEHKIIGFGKHPADFQNTIDYYANTMAKEKDCKTSYYSFILDTQGIIKPESFWGKLGKIFSTSNYFLFLAVLFFLNAFFQHLIFPIFTFTTESALLLYTTTQTSLLAGIFFLILAIYFKK